ncbi:MAG TPA: hypothetical protein VH917_02400, partial [Ignavibacteriaceae bacterium]
MKKIFYIIFISVTVLVSFGFKGCDQAYCEFLYNLNSAVGRFEFNEGEQFFAVGEEGIDEIELSECFDTIYSVGALSYITSIRFNVESGTGYYCAVGNAGNVQFSADGGQTWENRSISGLTDNLLGLDFLNYGGPDLPVVVCGEAGTMYTSTNSGSGWTWEKVNTTTTANLNSVIAINKSLFITVGDNGTILKTYDQGKKWENHTVG